MTIKIKAGKYYMTRIGQKVGPMRLRECGGYSCTHPWVTEGGMTFGMTYMHNGKYDTIGSKDGSNDIIAEWTGEAQLPYGHVRLTSGAVVDLTAITTPFGLIDEATQSAMRAHGGPHEWWDGNKWTDAKNGTMASWIAYRVKSQPPATVVGEVVMTGCITCSGPLFSFREMKNDTHRLTIPTRDGQLVTGTYTGPDGLTIKVESL